MTVQPTIYECPYVFMRCGDTIQGTTKGEKDNTGLHGIPDTNILVAVFEPTTLIFTTCYKTTEFESRLELYDNCPKGAADGSEVNVLAEQSDEFFCGYLSYDAIKEGTYWLVEKERRV